MSSKQGKVNSQQTNQMLGGMAERNEVELGQEFTIGNTKSQSQKKSGRQINKK